ncbi:MAG: nickel/cobalt transporter (NicO) family protein [Frankiales bacterium]|jgi:ABC-type nickel/cobalt efflux system permease component RcnA|nr:nickel/cobalt transporter (NicO) family protein [Frankiales bacterium]
MTARILTRLSVVAGIVCTAGVLAAGPASAHPLGNATVNHYDGLTLTTDRIDDHAVEDIAEIPTFQRKAGIDTDRNGVLSAAESAAYATGQCAALAGGNHLRVAGTAVAWQVTSAAYTERPGAIGGLTVGRLVCDLRAGSDLSSGATVALSDNWDGAGVGWHEITAVADGVSLDNSAVPATSISDELQNYPNDLLSSPLDVRSTTLDVVAGGGGSTYAKAKDLPVAGLAVRELNRLGNGFNNLVGRKHMGLGVGALALLLSLVLGAGHAFLPGHGKTVMAAYLVGRRGRLRDVITVGATVTITHTAGVLILGLLIALGAQFATVVVERDLAIISGGTVALVGLGLLVSAVRRRRAERLSHEEHLLHLDVDTLAVEEALVHEHADGVPVRALVLHGSTAGRATALAEAPHDHPHPHPHTHPAEAATHSHGWGQAHSHAPRDKGFSRSGLIGLGAAGGLVPSPSALLVLLAAVTAGRTIFGIGLVLAYGLGMALALCAAGLLVVRLQDRVTRLLAGRKLARLGWVASALPVLTASIVLVVGLGLMARAISGSV